MFCAALHINLLHMSLDRFHKLVARRLSGAASPQELQELEALCHRHPEWRRLLVQLEHERPLPGVQEEAEAEAAFGVHAMKFQLLQPQAPTATVVWYRRRLVQLTAIAALLVVLAGVGWQWSLQVPATPVPTNEVVSRKGSRSNIKLPDGTRVWLNADSKLTYVSDFSGPQREVTLSGEAYFDVVKDASRPFIIHTDKINIRVLGTAFNVKAYPTDAVIETALIHGKIEVTYTDRPSEKIILKPNEKLVIRKDQQTRAEPATALPKIQLNNLIPIGDSLIPETAWMDDKLVFSNETLANIAAMLERRFDVEVEVRSTDVAAFTYTGIFEKESLAKILELLSVSQAFHYQITESRVIIDR